MNLAPRDVSRPPRKDRPVTFALPPVATAQDAANLSSSVLAAVATGEITPSDAAEIGKLIETFLRAFEAAEISQRLDRLERMTNQ